MDQIVHQSSLSMYYVMSPSRWVQVAVSLFVYTFNLPIAAYACMYVRMYICTSV